MCAIKTKPLTKHGIVFLGCACSLAFLHHHVYCSGYTTFYNAYYGGQHIQVKEVFATGQQPPGRPCGTYNRMRIEKIFKFHASLTDWSND